MSESCCGKPSRAVLNWSAEAYGLSHRDQVERAEKITCNHLNPSFFARGPASLLNEVGAYLIKYGKTCTLLAIGSY